jgi:hypothetical protein
LVYNCPGRGEIVSLTNKERIGRSVELLRTALGPDVRRQLVEAYGDGWLDHVRPCIRDKHRAPEATLNDVGVLLSVVLREWEPLFRERFRGVDRDVIRSLRDVRNEWAHRPQEEFTAARASELLRRIATILSALGYEPDAALVRFEAENVTNASVGEPDKRLRAILIDTAANGQTFSVALRRGKHLGLSSEEVALGTKALRASQLLNFDDPLTESSLIRLAS